MLISICIPCYNSAKYLRETLNSLLSQTYQTIEIIVVDDNSIDGSLSVIKEIALQDKKIKFYKAQTYGAAAARNQAYKLCKGDYVIFFDADDWVPANFIETQFLSLTSNTEVVVSNWGRFYHNDITTMEIDSLQVKKDLTFEEWVIFYWHKNANMTCPGRILISRNLIEMSGLWDEDLSLNDDFTFYTRIFSNCTIIRYNNSSLFYYRSGLESLSSKKGIPYRLSLYQSLIIAIKVAESKLTPNPQLNRCYANLLQSFIYETYPLELKLIKESKKYVKLLGGSNLKHPAGGKTHILNFIIGWKLVAILKYKLNSLRR